MIVVNKLSIAPIRYAAVRTLSGAAISGNIPKPIQTTKNTVPNVTDLIIMRAPKWIGAIMVGIFLKAIAIKIENAIPINNAPTIGMRWIITLPPPTFTWLQFGEVMTLKLQADKTNIIIP